MATQLIDYVELVGNRRVLDMVDSYQVFFVPVYAPPRSVCYPCFQSLVKKEKAANNKQKDLLCHR
jgi:hypothetical protein